MKVCHDGDPEAALVQFASHSEALAAIRNTEAVLNNRFIKVFWHSKEQQQVQELNAGVNKTDQTENSNNQTSTNTKLSIKDRLGPKVGENTETVLTAVDSSGNISRTVFDPSKLKKTNINNVNNSSSIPEENNSSNMNYSSSKKAVQKSSEKSQKTQKQFDVYSKQHKLISELLINQKQLMSKYEKATSESDKKDILKTVRGVMDKIQVLKSSMEKAQNEMLAKKAANKPQTKEELMEEILNTDLEMYTRMQNNDLTYVELANKYAKLTKKAKTLGVSNYRSGPKPFPRRGRGIGRRGGYFPRGVNTLHKVDRRTRKILIPNIETDDITDLLEHLAVSLCFLSFAPIFLPFYCFKN